MIENVVKTNSVAKTNKIIICNFFFCHTVFKLSQLRIYQTALEYSEVLDECNIWHLIPRGLFYKITLSMHARTHAGSEFFDNEDWNMTSQPFFENVSTFGLGSYRVI